LTGFLCVTAECGGFAPGPGVRCHRCMVEEISSRMKRGCHCFAAEARGHAKGCGLREPKPEKKGHGFGDEVAEIFRKEYETEEKP
jgi:hypothetical protein